MYSNTRQIVIDTKKISSLISIRLPKFYCLLIWENKSTDSGDWGVITCSSLHLHFVSELCNKKFHNIWSLRTVMCKDSVLTPNDGEVFELLW